MPDVLDVSPEALGGRIREIRAGRFADPFLQELLARTGHRITRTALSRMENGKESVTLADIVALAKVDPKGRGREWLAFGVYEARKPRSAGVPMIQATIPAADPPTRQVAEQGRVYQATSQPAEVPKKPTRPASKRKA